MSFSGGGGSTGVTAHVHSNAAGEGGSLSVSDTLLENQSLALRILVGY